MLSSFVSEQQLHCSQVARLLVDLRRLRPPHRVGPISRAIKTNTFDPAMDDTSVLPRRDVRLVMTAAWEEVLGIS